jgi:hypothetical protein
MHASASSTAARAAAPSTPRCAICCARCPATRACAFSRERDAAATHGSDTQTLWTVLDAKTLPTTIAALDHLLGDCRDRAEMIAPAVHFGADTLDGAQLGRALAAARVCSQLNAEVAGGEDGDSAAFVFSALASLRALLSRAQAAGGRVAVFTWMPG